MNVHAIQDDSPVLKTLILNTPLSYYPFENRFKNPKDPTINKISTNFGLIQEIELTLETRGCAIQNQNTKENSFDSSKQ